MYTYEQQENLYFNIKNGFLQATKNEKCKKNCTSPLMNYLYIRELP